MATEDPFLGMGRRRYEEAMKPSTVTGQEIMGQYEMTGDQFRLAREELGMTQVQLARQIGVWRGTVNRWENGAPVPLYAVMIVRALLERAS